MSDVPEPSIDQFATSDFMRAALRRSVARYEAKFARLIAKAGVSGLSVSDPALTKRLDAQRQWNWAAFFGVFFWGIYRGVKYAWLVWAGSLILTLLALVFPDGLLDRGGDFAGIAISVVYAMLGTSWLLTTLVAARADMPDAHAPSLPRAIVAVGLYCAIAFAVGMTLG